VFGLDVDSRPFLSARHGVTPFCDITVIMVSMAGADDPFKDPLLTTSAAPSQAPPSSEPTREHMNVPDTLAFGRNASLTLGTDSLIVLGRKPKKISDLRKAHRL
jgi:hypothetical protein